MLPGWVPAVLLSNECSPDVLCPPWHTLPREWWGHLPSCAHRTPQRGWGCWDSISWALLHFPVQMGSPAPLGLKTIALGYY